MGPAGPSHRAEEARVGNTLGSGLTGLGSGVWTLGEARLGWADLVGSLLGWTGCLTLWNAPLSYSVHFTL